MANNFIYIYKEDRPEKQAGIFRLYTARGSAKLEYMYDQGHEHKGGSLYFEVWNPSLGTRTQAVVKPDRQFSSHALQILNPFLQELIVLDYVHTMPVRRENGMKKLLFPFLFTRCRYEIVRYRHFYRHKTMPVSKRYEMRT